MYRPVASFALAAGVFLVAFLVGVRMTSVFAALHAAFPGEPLSRWLASAQSAPVIPRFVVGVAIAYFIGAAVCWAIGNGRLTTWAAALVAATIGQGILKMAIDIADNPGFRRMSWFRYTLGSFSVVDLMLFLGCSLSVFAGWQLAAWSSRRITGWRGRRRA